MEGRWMEGWRGGGDGGVEGRGRAEGKVCEAMGVGGSNQAMMRNNTTPKDNIHVHKLRHGEEFNGIGMGRSSNGIGVGRSLNGIGMGRSLNGIGIGRSSNGIGVGRSSNEIGVERSSNGIGMGTSGLTAGHHHTPMCPLSLTEIGNKPLRVKQLKNGYSL